MKYVSISLRYVVWCFCWFQLQCLNGQQRKLVLKMMVLNCEKNCKSEIDWFVVKCFTTSLLIPPIMYILLYNVIILLLLRALAHYTQNCKKKVVILHKLYNFFSQLQQFFQQFYIWATIHTTICIWKVFAVLSVVCKGHHNLYHINTAHSSDDRQACFMSYTYTLSLLFIDTVFSKKPTKEPMKSHHWWKPWLTVWDEVTGSVEFLSQLMIFLVCTMMMDYAYVPTLNRTCTIIRLPLKLSC